MMLLNTVYPGAQTHNNDWSYTSNAPKGTDGIWLSMMQLAVPEKSLSATVRKSDGTFRKVPGASSGRPPLVVQDHIQQRAVHV